MDDILASVDIGNHSTINIATLSRQTVIESSAEHLGFSGYFIFEAKDAPDQKGITILGKVPSMDAAFRLMDIWSSTSGRPKFA